MRQDGRHAPTGTAEGSRLGRSSDPDEADLDIEDVEVVAAGGISNRRPVRAASRRPGTPAISLAIAAMAIAVVGLVAAGGLGGPSPTPTTDSVLSTPSPPSTLRVGATPNPGCRQLDAGASLPPFRLAAGPGDTGVRGLPGTPRPRFGTAYPDWHLPGPELALEAAPASDLRLVLATGVCAARVEVEAAPAELGNDPGLPDRQELLREFLDPVRDHVDFVAPSRGDWGLRIVVEYWSADSTGNARVEAFFRVRLGRGPFSSASGAPGPVVTPAVPCGPAPTRSEDIVLALTTGGSDPVPGVEPGDELPVVVVGPGEAIEIAVATSACATSWTIDVGTADSSTTIDGVPNPADDPASAAQNRWRFTLLALDEADLVVSARFGPSVLVERRWRVTGAPFEVPAAFVVAADGRRAEAHPGCGLGLELANGFSMEDECGSIGYDGSGARFEVDAGEVVDLEVPGWTIVRWTGQCGQLTEVDGVNVFEYEGCGLGGFAVDVGASAPPARFLLPPGDRIVMLLITATTLDGDRFTVPYFLPVSAR